VAGRHPRIRSARCTSATFAVSSARSGTAPKIGSIAGSTFAVIVSTSFADRQRRAGADVDVLSVGAGLPMRRRRTRRPRRRTKTQSIARVPLVRRGGSPASRDLTTYGISLGSSWPGP
jgi:hypothetical protein